MRLCQVLCTSLCVWSAAMAAETPPAPATTAAAGSPETTVLATVGRRAITQAEVDRMIGPAATRPTSPDILHYQRQQVLQQMIPQALLESYAADHPEMVSEEEVEKSLKEIQERLGERFETALKQFGMTLADLRGRLRGQLAARKYVDERSSDAQVDAFYEQHKADFDGTKVTAKHILIAVPRYFGKPEDFEAARKRILEIKEEIESGKTTFDEAINKYSDDPGRIRGPNLPPFTRYGRMVEPFAAAAFALKPGQISEPVRTLFGYHLIQVVAREPGQAETPEEAKPLIKSFLQSKAQEEFLAQQEARNPVKILMAYRKPPRPEIRTAPTTRPAMGSGATSTRPAGQVRVTPAFTRPARPSVTPQRTPEPQAPSGGPTAPPQ